MPGLHHGENGFIPVASVPEGHITKHKIYIAGHSETGHHHVIESDTEFSIIETGEGVLKDIYVQIFEPAKVVHKKTFEKHETKTLQPGIYRITHKTEYDPFNKVIRAVFD